MVTWICISSAYKKGCNSLELLMAPSPAPANFSDPGPAQTPILVSRESWLQLWLQGGGPVPVLPASAQTPTPTPNTLIPENFALLRR